jgi:predicted NUDIX family phosphoesterase
MPAEERVLCFERKLFEELGVFQGLSLDVDKYLPVVTASANLQYLNRSDAEQDRRYKQLIPYVLILCDGKILRYQRGKGGQETRLHGLYSVGIGGHISEEDHGLFSNDRGYQDGMRRELMEEIALEGVKDAAVAVINDDSTDVGCVHFGVVHVVRVADDAPGIRSAGGSGERPVGLRILVALLPGTSESAAGESRRVGCHCSRTDNGRIIPTVTGDCSVHRNHKMKTFEECQTLATQVPLSLRNDRDRIRLPVLGLGRFACGFALSETRAIAPLDCQS